MLKLKLTIAAAALLFSSVGNAASSIAGTITWMEVWRNGNVAFRLSDPASGSTCNGQFILNASDPGTKNQYAALWIGAGDDRSRSERRTPYL